jgi:hypothetical protein
MMDLLGRRVTESFFPLWSEIYERASTAVIVTDC